MSSTAGSQVVRQLGEITQEKGAGVRDNATKPDNNVYDLQRGSNEESRATKMKGEGKTYEE